MTGKASGHPRALPEALAAYQDRRAANTVSLVNAAIKRLKAGGKRISHASIREEAMRMPNGRRLSESTLIRNPGAYKAYAAAAPKRPRERIARGRWILDQLPEERRRDAVASLRLLRRKTRTELVMLALDLQQTIAKLEVQLSSLRATKLDDLIPPGVKVLRPLSKRK